MQNPYEKKYTDSLIAELKKGVQTERYGKNQIFTVLSRIKERGSRSNKTAAQNN